MSKLPFEVSIDFPLYSSNKGLYFIGQTPFLSGQNKKALASLYNPSDSDRLLYVNAITITNTSDVSLSAEFYLGSTCHHGRTSNLVSCTNTALCPIPQPTGSIVYVTSPSKPPTNGVSIFSRIVSPQSTLVVDGGQIILGKTQALSVYIGGFSPVTFDKVRFAFGWSEKEIHSCKK